MNILETEVTVALREQPAPVMLARGSSGRLNLLLSALLLVCVARLWLMPITSSFWVDEMGTSFVVRNGASDPSLRVVPQVPASLYYVLPRIAERLLGFSEAGYRIASVLVMVLALWLIALIARVLIHPDAGWFAVFACLALNDFNYQASDARPYALGTCVLCAGLWFLIRWLNSGKWLDAVLFLVTASVLWRVHLIFWPFYIVFVIYAVVRLARADSGVSWFRAIAIFTLLGLSLIPVLAGALSLYREAAAHVVVPAPSLTGLTASLKLGLITAICAGVASISRWYRWPRVESGISAGALSLILAWWLCDPVCLFAFSRLTGNSVFLSRYLYLALPGAALMATLVASWFIPAANWRSISLVLGLIVLLFMGRWNHVWPAHHNSDWRGAAGALNAQLLGPDTPIVCPSPFVEARPPVWRPDYPTSSFLYSHLMVYPINGKVYPFPFEGSRVTEEYAAKLSEQTLSPGGRFVLYGQDVMVRFWSEWFSARPELAGWHSHDLGRFGDVDVVVFAK